MLSHFVPGGCSWGTLHLPAAHLSPGCAWTHVHSGERPIALVPWCLPWSCKWGSSACVPKPDILVSSHFWWEPSWLTTSLCCWHPSLEGAPFLHEAPPNLPDHTPSSLTQLCSLKPGVSWSSTKVGTLSSWPPHFQHMEGKP